MTDSSLRNQTSWNLIQAPSANGAPTLSANTCPVPRRGRRTRIFLSPETGPACRNTAQSQGVVIHVPGGPPL